MEKHIFQLQSFFARQHIIIPMPHAKGRESLMNEQPIMLLKFFAPDKLNYIPTTDTMESAVEIGYVTRQLDQNNSIWYQWSEKGRDAFVDFISDNNVVYLPTFQFYQIDQKEFIMGEWWRTKTEDEETLLRLYKIRQLKPYAGLLPQEDMLSYVDILSQTINSFISPEARYQPENIVQDCQEIVQYLPTTSTLDRMWQNGLIKKRWVASPTPSHIYIQYAAQEMSSMHHYQITWAGVDYLKRWGFIDNTAEEHNLIAKNSNDEWVNFYAKHEI